jgi:nucleotide-binding universal stress UspA family protein
MNVADLLVPHDLTALSDRALALMAERGITGQRLHLVHALRRIDRSHPALIWSRDEDEPRRAHALRLLRERVAGGPWARATLHVVVGDPATRIVAVADEVGADLVALASHSRKGLGRVLLGSVAEHVARFAHCAVLVLPAVAVADVPVPAPPHPGGPRGAAPVAVADDVDALAVEVCQLVTERTGYLSALRIALPAAADASGWEDALGRRLAAAGIEFVDLAFTTSDGSCAQILAARFEALPEDP